MMRMAGRDTNGIAKALSVLNDGTLSVTPTENSNG